MRLLFVHADHLEFEASAVAPEAVTGTEEEFAEFEEEAAESEKKVAESEEENAGGEGVPMAGRMEDCVTAFVTVERADAADLDATVGNAAVEIRDVADQLGTSKITLYPSAHLSDDRANRDAAATALRDLHDALAADFEVLRAPLGRYTSVEVSWKGHPLSGVSRRVGPERGGGGEREADDPDRDRSEWAVAFPDGEVVDARDVAESDRIGDEMRAFVAAEVEGGPASEGETTGETGQLSHVELLREQGLAGEDDRGGAATLRGAATLQWFPRGKLVRDLLLEYVTDLAVEHGAMPVETPGAGDHRATRPASDLRATPAADRAERFSMVADGTVSEHDLPSSLYEVATHSSPGEQHDGGRGRSQEDRTCGREDRQTFTTPEIHTAAWDAEQAREELRAQAELCLRTAEDLGLSYVATVRTTREFYDDNGAWVESLVADLDTPALLELRPEYRHDWSASVDFAVVDEAGRPIVNPGVDLDLEPSGAFDFEDSENSTDDAGGADDAGSAGDDTDGAGEENRHPPILHCSPVGSIECVLAALLETPAGQEPLRLPTWLSPTQVRFVPVGEDHVGYCDALADDLESVGVRADVDDRERTVGERIARAERDWVPYLAVVGDREVEGDGSGEGDRDDDGRGGEDRDDDGRGDRDRDRDGGGDALQVTVRGEAEEREMDLAELQTTVLDDVGDLPQKRRYLPKHVGERPDFAGQ